MKPHPRIRKTIKWGGATLCVLILVAWGVSGWWWVGAFAADGWHGDISEGCVCISKSTPSGPWPFEIFTEALANPPIFRWWFNRVSAPGYRYIMIPLWAIAAPLAGITAIAWRLDTLARRRARAGLCANCHYDRAGLPPTAPCPECGTPRSARSEPAIPT